MNKSMEGGIAVFPRNKWVVDVFTGKGWDDHSVFRIYKGTLKLVGGSPVTETEYKQLQGMIA
jgi:hypothetical protein